MGGVSGALGLGVLVAVLCVTIFLAAVPSVFAVPTVSWDIGTGGSHALSDGAVGSPFSPTTVQFEIIDPDLATDPTLNTIQVLVNSTSDPAGITLTLTETSPTSGTFINTGLIFSQGPGSFSIPSKQTIGINNAALNTNSSKIETIIAGPSSFSGFQIFSTTDSSTGIFMNLTETGPNTGIFTNTLQFTSGSSVNGSAISVHGGDVVTIVNQANGDILNELALPNPDPSFGVLTANYGDEVDVVYEGVKDYMFLNAGSAPGGGGGGLIISPSLVVDALSGIAENIFYPPSIGNDYHNRYGGGFTINGKSFDIENYSTIIPAQVLSIDKPATFGFKIYDHRGAYTIAHVGMYFHFKGDAAVSNADTWISWDKYNGADIHDPNKIFKSYSEDVTPNGNYLEATFTLTPQKTMPDSSLIMRMWDDKLASGDIPIWGAIVIVDPNAPIPVKKVPTNKYGDYITLEQILDKDGYYIPLMLNKLHTMPQVYTSIDINWVYDKGVDKLTMVESDKSGNLMGMIMCNLTKKISEPLVTDHDYFVFTTQQLNRQDPVLEEQAKVTEAQKAAKIAEEFGLVRQNNFANWPLQN